MPGVRLATWNVNSALSRLPRLLPWLDERVPDVVCLQETKLSDEAFAESFAEPLKERGYAVAHVGEGRWNGVALLSRVGLDDVERSLPGAPHFSGALEARAVTATCAGLRVTSVYVPNGRTPDDPHYTYKLAWLAAVRDALVADVAAGPLVVTGDFNVAPTDDDVWDPQVFTGSTHVTPPERAALAAIREVGLTDVPARPLKGDHPFTYWDYRAGMFHQNKGMRIDLVYATADVAGVVKDAVVDREARKGKGPSDHAPIVVDLDR